MNYFAAVFSLFLLILPLSSHAKPIEIKSENFILRGDVRSKDGETLIRDLEIFRDNLFRLYGKTPKPEIIPVPIYAVKNEKQMTYVTGSKGFGGLYSTTLRGPAFVLNAKRGFGRKGSARHIALHEYSHHITASFVKEHFPIWYNEGYANYLATFSYKNGIFKIGEPHDPYAYALSEKNWMPMTVLLSSVKTYPFNRNDQSKIGQKTIQKFYAQAWLATHYLFTQDSMKGKLSDYMTRINKGDDPLKAFEEAVGMTPDAFETELKAYFKRNKFNVTQFTTEGAFDDIQMTTRELSERERKSYLLEARRAFSFNPKAAKATIAEYEKLDGDIGTDVKSLAAQADLKSSFSDDKEDLQDARDLAEAALALDPENIDANRVLGSIMVNQFTRQADSTKEDMIEARKYLRKVLADNINDPSANYYLAASYYQDNNIAHEGLRAARFAMDYYRDRNFVGSNLNIAGILANAGEYEQALTAVQFAKIWATEPGMRIQAQALKRYIDDRRKWSQR